MPYKCYSLWDFSLLWCYSISLFFFFHSPLRCVRQLFPPLIFGVAFSDAVSVHYRCRCNALKCSLCCDLACHKYKLKYRRVRTSFRANIKRMKMTTTTTNSHAYHCTENSTQNCARNRNKAQAITCASPKLNTKATYILNTNSNYIRRTFFLALFWVFLFSFFLCQLFFSHFAHAVVRFVCHVATNATVYFFSSVRRFFSSFALFYSTDWPWMWYFTRNHSRFVHLFCFQFSVAFICTFVSQNGLVCAWYFRRFEAWFSYSLFCMSSMVYVIRSSFALPCHEFCG